jgi:intracellular multiplication protein IcmD
VIEEIIVKNSIKKVKWQAWLTSITCFTALVLISQEAAASTSLGTMASSITNTFGKVGLMVTGGSYIAGLAFSIGAIMKFKQHKDNPTQIPIGTPIALVFIAAALLFLPSILSVTGTTMFGTKGTTAGPTGSTIQ